MAASRHSSSKNESSSSSGARSSRKRKRSSRSRSNSADAFYGKDRDAGARERDEEIDRDFADAEKHLSRLSAYEAHCYYNKTATLDPRVYESRLIKQQDIIQRALVENEFRPFTGDSSDGRFTELDGELLEASFDVFDLDKISGIGYRNMCSRLVGGGMQFEVAGKVMEGASHLWHADVYSDLTRAIIRLKWVCGFVPILTIPNEEYVGEPRVLDLRQVRVFYCTNFYGITLWGFMLKDTESYDVGGLTVNLSSSRDMISRDRNKPIGAERERDAAIHRILRLSGGVIPGVVTKTFFCPVNGELRSPFETLLKECRWMELLRECAAIAIRKRAVRGFAIETKAVTKEMSARFEADRKVGAGDGASAPSDNDVEMAQRYGADSGRPRYNHSTYQEAAMALRLMNQMGGNREDLEMVLQLIQTKRDSGMNNSFGPFIALDENQQFVPAPEAFEPEGVREWVDMQAKHTLVAWGLPASLLDPKGHVVMDSAAQNYVKGNEQTAKNELCLLLSAAYDRINRGGLAGAAVDDRLHAAQLELELLDAGWKSASSGSDSGSDSESEEETEEEGATKHAPATGKEERKTGAAAEDAVLNKFAVKISLFGIPESDVMKELYQWGILKYRHFKGFAARHYGIPDEHLHDEPELSVLDLLTSGQQQTEEMRMKHEDKQAKSTAKIEDKRVRLEYKHDEKMAKMSESTALKTIKAKPAAGAAAPKAKAKKATGSKGGRSASGKAPKKKAKKAK